MAHERWLLTGASGQLGGHLVRALLSDLHASELLALAGTSDVYAQHVATRIDLAELDDLSAAVRDFHPTHILHVGAMTAVSACFDHPDRAVRVNVDATRVLAEAARACASRMVFTSTDMVFAGDAAPYRESDAPNPVSRYGRTKAAAERLLATFDNVLSVRIPLMYGMPVTDRRTTFARQIAALKSRERLRLFADEFRTPISLHDAARALIGLARSDRTGLMHVAGRERLSRLEIIRRCGALLGIADPKIEAISRLSIDSVEPRPADLSLDGATFVERFPDLAPAPLDRSVFAGE